ncbi:hypothetical protein MIR68_006898 [Amoeboaphelidium protococcarum]|nr:hypothetical protein MIR68_006898 [Amoeboaphelidium protococcarum]
MPRLPNSEKLIEAITKKMVNPGRAGLNQSMINDQVNKIAAESSNSNLTPYQFFMKMEITKACNQSTTSFFQLTARQWTKLSEYDRMKYAELAHSHNMKVMQKSNGANTGDNSNGSDVSQSTSLVNSQQQSQSEEYQEGYSFFCQINFPTLMQKLGADNSRITEDSIKSHLTICWRYLNAGQRNLFRRMEGKLRGDPPAKKSSTQMVAFYHYVVSNYASTALELSSYDHFSIMKHILAQWRDLPQNEKNVYALDALCLQYNIQDVDQRRFNSSKCLSISTLAAQMKAQFDESGDKDLEPSEKQLQMYAAMNQQRTRRSRQPALRLSPELKTQFHNLLLLRQSALKCVLYNDHGSAFFKYLVHHCIVSQNPPQSDTLDNAWHKWLTDDLALKLLKISTPIRKSRLSTAGNDKAKSIDRDSSKFKLSMNKHEKQLHEQFLHRRVNELKIERFGNAYLHDKAEDDVELLTFETHMPKNALSVERKFDAKERQKLVQLAQQEWDALTDTPERHAEILSAVIRSELFKCRLNHKYINFMIGYKLEHDFLGTMSSRRVKDNNDNATDLDVAAQFKMLDAEQRQHHAKIGFRHNIQTLFDQNIASIASLMPLPVLDYYYGCIAQQHQDANIRQDEQTGGLRFSTDLMADSLSKVARPSRGEDDSSSLVLQQIIKTIFYGYQQRQQMVPKVVDFIQLYKIRGICNQQFVESVGTSTQIIKSPLHYYFHSQVQFPIQSERLNESGDSADDNVQLAKIQTECLSFLNRWNGTQDN